MFQAVLLWATLALLPGRVGAARVFIRTGSPEGGAGKTRQQSLVRLGLLGRRRARCDLLKESNTESVQNIEPAKGRWLRFEDMPAHPSTWPAMKAELYDEFEYKNQTYGKINATYGPTMLYEGTKVPELLAKIPPALRGVFWMKDNPVPEVLAVLQYGSWFEEQQTYVSQFVPFGWAFWGGPRKAPRRCGWICKAAYMLNSGKKWAYGQTNPEHNYTYGVSFSPCPAGRRCVENSTNHTYGRLQIKGGCDLKSNNGGTQLWTMEELPGVQSGSLWWRGVYTNCGRYHAGGYTLAKIIDEHGARIEPYFSDYLLWMEGQPLIVWSGYPHMWRTPNESASTSTLSDESASASASKPPP